MPDIVVVTETRVDVVTVTGSGTTDTIQVTGDKQLEVLTMGVQGPQGPGSVLTPATNTTLGGIIVGENLSINANGVLSAQAVGDWGNIAGAPNITTDPDGSVSIYGRVNTDTGNGFPNNLSKAFLSNYFLVQAYSESMVFAGDQSNLTFASGDGGNMSFSATGGKYSILMRDKNGTRQLSMGHYNSPNPAFTQGIYMRDGTQAGSTFGRIDGVESTTFGASGYCMRLYHTETGATRVPSILIFKDRIEIRDTTSLTSAYSVLNRSQGDSRYVLKTVRPG